MQERKSEAPTFPDAEYVGPHLVIDKTEWVPGANPEPILREGRQTTYPETYFRCIRCGAERLRERDFPAECNVPMDEGVSSERDVSSEKAVSAENDARPEIDATEVGHR